MRKPLIAIGIISLFLLLITRLPSNKELPTTFTSLLPCETGCPDKYGSNAVWDFNQKECWSCPPGYVRNFELVTSRRACVLYKYGLYADAKREGKLDCGEMLFANTK